MADRFIKTETLQDIANAIREKRSTGYAIKPSNFANEIRCIEGNGEEFETYYDSVTVDEGETVTFTDDYSEGYKQGVDDGKLMVEVYDDAVTVDEGVTSTFTDDYSDGRKYEYDEFWDNFQKNKGEPFKYYTAFSGKQWNDVTFKPKYDIVCEATNNQNMFTQSAMTDIVATLEERGVKLDTSRATTLAWSFSQSKTTRIPTLSLVSVGESGTNGLCDHASNLHTIEKLVVARNTPFATSTFEGCTALESLTVEGTIGRNGFSVRWSEKLNRQSIESIIRALATDTSDLLVTLSEVAVNNAFSTDEWKALKAERSNWRIELA